MQDAIARRQFLKTVGMGTLAGAGLGTGVLAAPLAHAASAEVTPSQSNLAPSTMPRLLAGCCAYSYREQFTHGQMTLEDLIRKAVDLRLDAVDMTVYYLKSTDPGYLEGLRHLAYQNAVAFSGAACNATMVQADAARRADVLGQIKKWVDVTDRLGASHLRIFAGPLPAGTTIQQATGWVVETMKAACDYSAQKGITLGLEDHQGVSQTADVCLEIMQRVNSPYAGINIDITHFIPSPTQDAYAQIAACIPYATVTHIRDRFDDHTAIDLDRVWRMFAQAGHKGSMSLEYEGSASGSETAITGVPRMTAKIRELCKKYSSI
jgi:sugar phosphate isomerase/epimerase